MRRQAGDPVQIRYVKWWGALHWHYETSFIGEDRHGEWFVGRPGVVVRKGEGEAHIDRGGFVTLIPRSGKWTGLWNAKGEPEVYVDLTRPLTSSVDSVCLIDLDLDVARYRNGVVRLLDEDEFHAHRAQAGYPTEIVVSVTAAAASLVRAVSDRTEPFGAVGLTWLREAVD